MHFKRKAYQKSGEYKYGELGYESQIWDVRTVGNYLVLDQLQPWSVLSHALPVFQFYSETAYATVSICEFILRQVTLTSAEHEETTSGYQCLQTRLAISCLF